MRNRLYIVWVGLWALGLVACSAVLSTEDRPVRESGPQFSHVQHIDMGIDDCSFCHGDPDAEVAEMPTLEVCNECHEDIDPEAEEGHRALDYFDEDGKGLWAKPMKDDGSDVMFHHGVHAAQDETCMLCHADVAASEQVLNGHSFSMENCMTCHAEHAPESNQCSTCHEKIREDVAPRSHRGNWDRAHGRHAILGDYDDLPRDCAYCHERSFCDDCHQAEAPRNHTNHFRLAGHASMASIDRDSCNVCHTSDSCFECHQQVAPRSHRGVWGAPFNRHCNGCHIPAAAREGSGCGVCHADSPSHMMAPPRPGNPIHQTTDSNLCRECHTPPEHPDNGQSCLLCHQ